MTASGRRAGPRSRRARLAIEVVQTSAMDCGPAALQCLLEGHGIPIHYHRLRELCHTGIDGTSIDALEDIAVRLGLDAEQVMVPTDHLLLRASRCLPALAVTRLAGGMTHFVVVWSTQAGWVQMMDPATGRLWVRSTRFLESLYRHTQEVDAGGYRAWCASEEAESTLRERMRRLGIPSPAARQFLSTAHADPTWRSFARLDASLRATMSLVSGGGARRGLEATRVARALGEPPGQGDPWDARIPRDYWSARPAAVGATETLLMSGCVLLRTPRGRRDDSIVAPNETAGMAPNADLVELRDDHRRGTARALATYLAPTHGRLAAMLGSATVLATIGTLGLAMVLRALAGIGPASDDPGIRLAFVLSLVVLAVALGLLDAPIGLEAHRLGRRLEARMRLSILERLPWARSRYLSSLPTSDIAERGHALDGLHALPVQIVAWSRAACEWLAMAIGSAVLVPELWPAVLALSLLTLPIVWFSRSVVDEQDLRVRVLSGALTRLHLDALIGLFPIRAHGAGPTLRRQHTRLLAEWGKAQMAVARTGLVTSLLLMLATVAAFCVLGLPRLNGGERAAASLLAAFWVMRLPVTAQRIDAIGRDLLSRRNVARRALELATGSDDTERAHPAVEPGAPARAPTTGGVTFRAEHAEVQRGGRAVLRDLHFEIRSGCHVAIVGPSGSGKSTLVAWMLGWHPTASGRLWVDEAEATAATLHALRAQTAWAEAKTTLWDDTLEGNLAYGLDADGRTAAIDCLKPCELLPVVRSFPAGMQAGLGEGGGRLSHGEAQCVRFGRAYGRRTARLVVLDEAFSGLDREQRRRLSEKARLRWPAATMLCVTHDIADAMHFDRVLVLSEGRILEDGEPAGLAANKGSRFAGLLAAEGTALVPLDSDRWQRLSLECGRLRSDPIAR